MSKREVTSKNSTKQQLSEETTPKDSQPREDSVVSQFVSLVKLRGANTSLDEVKKLQRREIERYFRKLVRPVSFSFKHIVSQYTSSLFQKTQTIDS